MPHKLKLPTIIEEDALGRIISWLRNPKRNNDPLNRPNYGHDLYVPNVILDCLDEVMRQHRSENPRGMITYEFDETTGAEPFYGAA